MSQEECSRKSKKINNKKYVLAGSLVSLRNKKISSHQQKHTSTCILDVLKVKLNENNHNLKQNLHYIQASSQIQHVSMNFTSSVEQTISTTPHHRKYMNKCNKIWHIPPLLHRKQFRNKYNKIMYRILPISMKTANLRSKRKRGGTQMPAIHGCTKRKLIVLNELHQPIGPTEAVVKELSSFLGTLARNETFCPLNVLNWKELKTHKDMWNYIKEKYDIPNVGKEWALDAIQLAWREYKSRIKKKYFYAYDNDETRMAKIPKNVPESVFKDLLHYWNSDEAENISKTNKENRKKLRYPHTVGKIGFAIIRENQKKEGQDKYFFVVTRRQKPG